MVTEYRRLVAFMVAVFTTATMGTGGLPISAAVTTGQQTPQQGIVATQSGLTVSGKVLRNNDAVPDVRLRCRNLDTNAIVGYTTSDKQGAFSFTLPAPGRYIVEAIKDDGSVFAIGSPLNVTGAAAITGANVLLGSSRAALLWLGIAGAAAVGGLTAYQLTTNGATPAPPPVSPER